MRDGPWPWGRFCPRILFLKLLLLQNMVWWCNQGNQTLLTIWITFGTRKHTANGLPSRHPSTGNKRDGVRLQTRSQAMVTLGGVLDGVGMEAWSRAHPMRRFRGVGNPPRRGDSVLFWLFSSLLGEPRGSITDMCGLLENHAFVVANSTTTRAFPSMRDGFPVGRCVLAPDFYSTSGFYIPGNSALSFVTCRFTARRHGQEESGRWRKGHTSPRL